MSDRIFELVHSLNKSEKRYFKQFLKRHSSNIDDTIYARFFDYITRTDTYNKVLLLKKCPFIKTAQLQNIRFRLYNLILDSLRGFYSGKSIRIQIYQMIISAEILVSKGLFVQAVKKLEKAEKLAYYNELDGLLKDILGELEHLVTTRLKNKTHKKEIIEIQQKYKASVLFHEKVNALVNLRAEGYNLFRAEGRLLRNRSDGENYFELIKKFDNTFELNENSFKETFNYYNEASTAVRFQGFFKESYAFLEKIEQFCLIHEHYKIVYFKEYIRFLSHKVIVSNMLKDFDNSLKILKEINLYYEKAESKEIQILIFENVIFHEIEVYLYQGKFNLAVELAEKNMDKLEVIKGEIHSVNKQSKYYRIALSYFGNNEFKKALRWINQIINFDEMKYRKDILSSVATVNLLIHFELGNYALLENRLQTTIQHLKKMDRWLTPERLIIQAIRDIVLNEKSPLVSFIKLKDDFIKCVKINPLDEYFIAYLDFEKWLDNKITTLLN